MESFIENEYRKFRRNRHLQKIWHRIVAGLSAVSIFITTYALMMPAITMVTDDVAVCGMVNHKHDDTCYQEIAVASFSCTEQVHQHTDDCFDKDGNPICGRADYALHIHTGDCYDEEGDLRCPLRELDEHLHDESCYSADHVLTCLKEEAVYHAHTDFCYDESGALVCGCLELLWHEHAGCVGLSAEKVLVCLLPEHEHDMQCLLDAEALRVRSRYSCGYGYEHTHDESCYVNDTLICSLSEHQHTADCLNCTCDSEDDLLHDPSCPRYAVTNDLTDSQKTEEEMQVHSLSVSEPVRSRSLSSGTNALGSGNPTPTEDSTVTLKKQIESLSSDNDLYRLYLTLEAQPQAVDLMLVIDQSESMGLAFDGTSSGTSRQEILRSMLYGDGSNPGFIQEFLASNSENDLAMLTFGSDCDINRLSARVLKNWGEDAAALDDSMLSGSATNYAAALCGANELWAEKSGSEHRKIMIFLSDGEPTVAYADGGLHTGASNILTTGYGDALADTDLTGFIDGLLTLINSNASSSTLENTISNYLYNREPITDDDGNSVTVPMFSSYRSGNIPGDGYAAYPYAVNIQEMKLKPNGFLENLPCGFDKNKEKNAFLAFYGSYSGQSAAGKRSMIWQSSDDYSSVVVGSGDITSYDLFALTESAFDEFCAANEDIVTFTVGFSSSADDGDLYTSGVPMDSMLRYMAQNGGYYYGGSPSALTDAVNSITVLSGITMTDTLSSYAEFADDPDFTITLTDGSGTQTLLYADGGITTAGEGYLDPDGTGLDSNGSVMVQLLPGVLFNEEMSVTASFNIRPTEIAVTMGNRIGYLNVGDTDTDYGTNQTSSGREGFFSNGKAEASWNRGGEHSDSFPRPVLQVLLDDPGDPTATEDETVTLKKQIESLDDDLYRLYLMLEADPQPIDLLLVIDQSGSMEKDVNGVPSNKDGYAGISRQEILRSFLYGSEEDDDSGFIHRFLNSNEENDLAMLSFGSDCVMDPNAESTMKASKRLLKNWGRGVEAIDLDDSFLSGSATNYSAALYNADLIWDDKEGSTNKKIMIFLSDGEPTVTYSDGGLHTGLANDDTAGFRIVGDGSAGVSGEVHDLTSWIVQSVEMMYKYLELNIPLLTDYIFEHFFTGNAAEDDYGVSQYLPPFSGLIIGDEIASFPNTVRIPDLDICIPGVDVVAHDIDTEVFSSFYSVFSSLSDDQKRSLVLNDLTIGGTVYPALVQGEYIVYDLFGLTMNAYDAFHTVNPDVSTFTVGFSKDVDEMQMYPNGIRKDLVLNYMSKNGGYYYCDDSDSLSAAINSIAMLTNITMTDTLSQYTEFADDPDLEITLTEGSGADAVTTVLYADGAVTTEGSAYLDPVQTFLSRNSSSVQVKFLPEAMFNEDMTVTASFKVRPTDTAVEEFSESGSFPHIGDDDTDYGVNDTSSGKPGFYSNDEAKASWSRGGDHSRDFPKPVIQVIDPSGPAYELPSTGGIGVRRFFAFGMAVMVTSAYGLVLFSLRRRKTAAIA